tara:strand:+ start:1230 stop:3137 length:1908 start_codon:yes stop_codon:yes gene_type:complete
MAEVKEFELKVSTKQAQENVEELNKSLEAQVDLIDEIEKELSGYEKKLVKTSKTNLAARKDLNDKIKQTKDRLKDEKVGLKDVTKERNKSNKTLKEAKKNSADYSGVLGMLDSKTGGVISGIARMTTGIGGATKGLKLMKIAIIGTGIGALLIAVTSLTAAFTSNEEGQNKLAKIMAVIGSVTGNLVTMLSDLGMGIIAAFENPKESILAFKDLLVENVTNRITSLIDTFGFLGTAIKKVFERDFSGALEAAKSAGSSMVDSFTGVKDTINKVGDAVGDLTTEIVNEGKAAARIADQRAKADKLDRKLTVERAEANKKRAELLDKAAQKEKFTAQERIQFLEEAGRIEEEITNKELKSAKLRYDAKVAENALANSTKADLDEEAQLQAQLINLETAKLRKSKAVSSQIVGAKREEEAELKAINDKILADQKVANIKKIKEDKVAADALVQIEKDKAAQKQAIQTAQLSNISNGINLLKQIAGKNKALQAAAIIAESAMGIAKTVISTQAANAGALATPQAILTSGAAAVPVITANKINAAIGIASNIAATRKALQGLKAGGSPPPPANIRGATNATAAADPTPPEFNTVGASGTNQLADAIGGQNKQPIKTYVVAGDVTTAQGLERNTIKGATIG